MPKIEIHFKFHMHVENKNETMKITGNIEEFGMWDPFSGLNLIQKDLPYFTNNIELNYNNCLYYFFFILRILYYLLFFI